LFSNNFFHRFNYNWYFHYLLSNFLDILIYSNYLRNHPLYLYKFGDFNKLLPHSFDLIDLRNSDCLLNHLLNDLLSCNYLLHFCLNRNEFLDDCWHFFDNFLEIWHDLFDLHNRFLNKDALHDFLDLSDFNNFMDHRNDFLHYLRNRNNSFDNLLSWNNFLNYSINGNRNFKRHDNLFFNWDWERYLNILSHDLFDSDRPWYLLNSIDWNLP
jgi:hypothetical protein